MFAHFITFASRNTWRVAILLTLALLAWLSTSFGIPLARAGWLAPNQVLNPDGTMKLNTEQSGAVDVRGWNVQLDPQRGPVFAPQAPTADIWSTLGNGLNGGVYAVTLNGSEVYVGGTFTRVCENDACDSGNLTMNRIAKWNGNFWSALGHGVRDTVRAIAVSGSEVYVGGLFSEVCGNDACDSGNMTVNRVAKWNGSNWAVLGNGVSGSSVRAIAVSEGEVFVGGSFTQVCGNSACNSGNVTVNNIAKWNGSNWSALGNGLESAVVALAANGGQVYVGGFFRQVCGNSACNSGNVTMNFIARWNGIAWSALGNGVNSIVYALTVSGSEVYVGGLFGQVCGNSACNSSNVTVNRIAKWNGSAWSALGNGVNSIVYALAINGSDVYVGGDFVQLCGNSECNSGNVTVNYIARWNGATWSALGNGVNNNATAVSVNGSDVYVGGFFTVVCGNGVCDSGNVIMNRIAKYGPPPPTPTPTATPTNTLTNTPTFTPTHTPTSTPTNSCVSKPAAPILVAPASGATLDKGKVELEWNNVACETKYKVRVKDAASNAKVFKTNLGADVTFVKTSALPKGETYKWFVKACNAFGCEKSGAQEFTLAP